jgi:hypothetical protein
MEYGMTDQKIAIKCRISLLYYLMKRLGIKKKDDDIPGEEQQIAVLNKSEIFATMDQ